MNPTKTAQILDGFVRQRRNLMIISLVLFFAESAELTVSKLNVFGNELLIAHPTTVTTALWIGFFYWLWRYYAYFHDLGEKGFLSTYHRRAFKLVQQIAFRQLQRDSQFVKRAQGRKASVVANNSSYSFRSPFRYVVNLTVAFMQPTEQINAPSEVIPFQGIEVTTRMPLLISHARAWLYVFTRTHLSSEYLLPYLVAAAPLAYLATKALMLA